MAADFLDRDLTVIHLDQARNRPGTWIDKRKRACTSTTSLWIRSGNHSHREGGHEPDSGRLGTPISGGRLMGWPDWIARPKEKYDKTDARCVVSYRKKTALLHEPSFENDASGTHHGVAATAVQSREAEYIYGRLPAREAMFLTLVCLQPCIRSRSTLMGSPEQPH